MMNPKFADRIARRITVVKRTKGQAAAGELATKLMGYAPKGHPDYVAVLSRIDHYKGSGTVTDR
jgi:hypothetical protein